MNTSVMEEAQSATSGVRNSQRRIEPIPFSRVVSSELRKMFNTRAGVWLVASVGIFAVVASAGVIAFGSDGAQQYGNFGAAVGMPASVILPVLGILSVTSEFSQRTALTSFTLVPSRGRVMLAKFLVVVAIGVLSMLAAMGIGAIGNILGTSIHGVDTVWDIGLINVGTLVLSQVLGMMLGFMLGVVLRSSPGAIVGYFVLTLVIPGIFQTLANFQEWFLDVWFWIDFNVARGPLYEGDLTGENWAQVGVTALMWIFVPLVFGLWRTMKVEIK